MSPALPAMMSVAPSELNRHNNREELYFMLLVTSAVRTLLSNISLNGMSPITLNKKIGNHLNMDIIYASNL